MKKIHIIFIIIFGIITQEAIAQESSHQDTTVYEYYVDDGSRVEEKPVKEKQVKQKSGSSIMDNIYFGGGFGAWFSEDYSYLELSPIAGYPVSRKLSLGLGFTYRYTNRRYYYTNGDSFKKSTNSFGPRIFARMSVYGPIFLYGEYETISYEYPSGTDFVREWVPATFLGAGFMKPIGRKGGVGVMILYNFQYDEYRSPYNSEWVYRISFFL